MQRSSSLPSPAETLGSTEGQIGIETDFCTDDYCDGSCSNNDVEDYDLYRYYYGTGRQPQKLRRLLLRARSVLTAARFSRAGRALSCS